MPSPPGSPWRLRPLGLPDFPEAVTVPEAGLTMGRDPSNALVFPSGSHPGVSAFHCRVSVDNGELLVEDLGSRNGTYVDGEQVERAVLRPGSTLTLGSRGPRFAIPGSEMNSETVLMRPEQGRRSIGDETVSFVRDRLGIPSDAGVAEMLKLQRRRTSRLVGAMATILVVALGVSIWVLSQSGSEARAALLQSLRRDLDEQRREWDAAREALVTSWEDGRVELQSERTRLQAEMQDLQAGGQTASETIQRLQAELDRTNRILKSYDPINLQQSRLEKVRRVQDAVVLVEVRETFVEEASKNVLHMSYDSRGNPDPNTEGRGERLVQESSGSGICVSPDGHILTNAHVVREKGSARVTRLGNPPVTFLSQVELSVAFSGTDQRYPATVIEVRNEGREDLALVKIEPFAGMHYLPDVDVQTPHPTEGTEVFVIGFPLGTQTLQEGNRVIASTFRGIVSRYVEPFVQVDAAVHPGASGGPLIDGEGRLLGIVVGRQRTDDTGGASLAMGFIIPIEDAAGLWPR